MLEKLKIRIYQDLEALFTTAVVDEIAGDMRAYRSKLNEIAKIAEILGIDTDIISVNINIKDKESEEECNSK